MLAYGLSGSFVQRSDKRRALIITDVMRLVLVLAVGLTKSQYIVFVAVLFLSTIGSIYGSALNALMQHLTRGPHRGKYNAYFSISYWGGELVGSGVAGFVVIEWGVRLPFFIDALTFVIAILATLRIFSNAPKLTSRTGRWEVLSHIVEGFKFIATNRLMKLMVAVNYLVNMAMAYLASLQVVFVRTHLQASAAQYGVLVGLGSAGMLISSWLVSFVYPKLGTQKSMSLGLLAAGLCIFLYGISPGILVADISWFLSGLGFAGYDVAMMTALQNLIPEQEFVGVRNATNFGGKAIAIIGIVFGGVLTVKLSVSSITVGCAVILAVVGVMLSLVKTDAEKL